jgi:DNA-binding response OmpR family regulator
MGGYEFLASIRARSQTALLPFILLSAAAGSEARTEGLNAGADDYLVKPFASKELLARVKTHLELGAMRRALESRVQERTRLLVESETRLLQQIAELKHMRKQQEIVVDLTSHELRNPLNAIWQNAELVEVALGRLKSRLGKEAGNVLEEANEAVQNVSRAEQANA